MNKYQGEFKKKLDREYVVWCCKSAKPLSMAENDKHFRRFCSSISNGRYLPPCKKVAAHELITLVATSREMIKAQIQEVLDVDCLDMSISGKSLYSLCRPTYPLDLCSSSYIVGDIWSENGIAIFAVMGYWIDKGFVFHEKVCPGLQNS